MFFGVLEANVPDDPVLRRSSVVQLHNNQLKYNRIVRYLIKGWYDTLYFSQPSSFFLIVLHGFHWEYGMNSRGVYLIPLDM
jgi:hypothetical protein